MVPGELASSTAQQAGQEHLAWLLVDQQRLNFSRLRLRSGARRLAGLPEAQREVVALKIDGGLTFAQIAKVTNVSLNTAAGRYRYALDKLRAALAVEVIR